MECRRTENFCCGITFTDLERTTSERVELCINNQTGAAADLYELAYFLMKKARKMAALDAKHSLDRTD